MVERQALPAFPEIDYASHPGYVDLARGAADAELDALAADVDTGYAMLSSAPPLERSAFEVAFDDAIAKPLAALATRAGALAGGDARSVAWMVASSRAAEPQLRSELDLAWRRGHRLQEPQGITAASRLASELGRDGAAALSIDPSAQRALLEATRPFRRALEMRAASDPAARQWIPLPPGSQALRVLIALLDTVGARAAAERYRGVPMELDHAAIHYSHSAQRWVRACYADVGLGQPKLTYLHFDKDTISVKALVYLHPVEPGEGEFAYIAGSHRWARSPLRHALRNQLDTEYHRVYGREAQGDVYYRPRFRDPAGRARMLALPALFHGCSHFGDDLIDGDALALRLEQHERRFVGDVGGALFDGGFGAHRGGISYGEPRWAIQIGWRPVPERGAGAALRHYARELWQDARGRWQERAGRHART